MQGARVLYQPSLKRLLGGIGIYTYRRPDAAAKGWPRKRCSSVHRLPGAPSPGHPPSHTLWPPKARLRPAAAIQRLSPGQAVCFSFSFPGKKAVLPVSPLCSDRVRKAQKQSLSRCFFLFSPLYPGALPKTSRTKSQCSFRFMPASCPAKLAVRPLSSSGHLFPSPSAPCFYAEKATPLSFASSVPSAF